VKSPAEFFCNLFKEHFVVPFIMYKIVAWLLLFCLLTLEAAPLWASDDSHSELLGQMSLQAHYQRMLQEREQQRYNLELELETLTGMESSGSLSPAHARRLEQIRSDMAVIDQSIASSQARLIEVNRSIDEVRTRDYGAQGTTADEELSATLGAANAATTLNGFTALTGALTSPGATTLPNGGVVAQANGTVTRVEQWNNGRYYEVTRYSEGPNRGSFAPGGRREISAQEIRAMGSELRAAHVEGLRGNIVHADQRLASLRQQLAQTKNPEVRTQLRQEIDQTRRVQSELKTELRQSQARPLTDFVKAGASFAAMSVAVTGGMNIMRQVIDNGGDLGAVDYGQAFSFVTQGQFWAGIGGAYTGGMVGAALTSFLPGPFKVLGAVAGASVGHQIAVGGLNQTDWASLAASAIGSTIGFYLGAFVGSFLGPFAPVAIIAFSMLGSYLGGLALNWLRDTFSPKLEGVSFLENRSQEEVELEELANSIDTQELAALQNLPISELREEMWITYEAYRIEQEVGTQIVNDDQRIEWERNMEQLWTRYEFIRNLITQRKQEFAADNQSIPAAVPGR